MPPTEWELTGTIQKKIRVTRIDVKNRYVDVRDLDEDLPMSLTAAPSIDLAKIKKAKMYTVTLRIFKTELTPELERYAFEKALPDRRRLKALQTLKDSGERPTKYELIELKR